MAVTLGLFIVLYYVWYFVSVFKEKIQGKTFDKAST